ncbi:unknown protein [Stanieria sp. NIES-3757]|nr:unknown protein [Stanieria sp. NIES-3757]
MSEELIELRKSIEAHDYKTALLLVDRLEEMSLEDKLNKIYSYTIILLLHLIKQEAEGRTTRSWDNSILNSIEQIKRTNKRRKSNGYYASTSDLAEIIDEAIERALRDAAEEAFGGVYSEKEILDRIDLAAIKAKALSLIDTP